MNGVFSARRLCRRRAELKLSAMKILILIAGIADPKWPLPALINPQTLQEHSASHAALSPFDEAALELALKLRESDPSNTLHALVGGSEKFARKIAEWRLDSVHRFDESAAAAWDANRFAKGLVEASKSVCDPSLVLVGREFGDFDDGCVPALIAHDFGMPQFSLVMDVAFSDGAMWGTRQRAGSIERFRVPERALLSVTNDPRNRLRHPLMKNVMAAKRLNVPAVALTQVAATVELRSFELARPAKRGGACRMLAGTPSEQCLALAEVLLQRSIA